MENEINTAVADMPCIGVENLNTVNPHKSINSNIAFTIRVKYSIMYEKILKEKMR
jgi:hypothetical protein